jgi:glycine/D-amino acid oxidase-like deaminating enzyme
MKPDITIVGQGVCGSLLSWALIHRGLSVQVYDTGINSSATIAAAGIINPVTGKRLVKSWLTDTLVPAADEMYAAISRKLGVEFYQKQLIYKLPESIKEQNDWSARLSEPGYESCFEFDTIQHLDKSKVHNPFGALVIKGAKMDTGNFLNHYREYLRSGDMLREEPYTYDRALSQKGKVIFCDGYRAAKQGPFSGLLWQIVKGEYLLVKIKDFYSDRIISGDTTISATDQKDIYYAGATYQWYYETTEPTGQYKQEIIDSLKKTLAVPFEVIAHGAAVRPAVKYRRPFIGFHPVYPHIGIFNGMGTKGLSLSPYFAEHMAEHITTGSALMQEVDVARLL